MKNYLLTVTVLMLFFVENSKAAQDYGLELGIRQQAGEAVGTSISTNSQLGAQFGGYYHHPLEGGTAHWRTGLLYTQRPLQSENDLTGVKINYQTDYLDVPMDILFKPSEQLGFYFGFHVSILVSDSCSGDVSCKMNSVTTPLFPWIFGVMYKFTPKMGFNFYIDGTSSNTAKGLYDYRAVGLNLTYSLN